MDEEVINLLEFMNALIELDIGKYATCDSNRTNSSFPQPETNKFDAYLFQQELDTCGEIRFIKINRETTGDLLQRRTVIHRHRILNLSRVLVAHKLTQDIEVGWLAQGGQTGDLALMA